MKAPLVSVSLVAFNAERYIRDAIEGCLMQETDFPFEIIIHDDASVDDTPDIIEDYASKYPEIIVPIIQKENRYSQGIEINAQITIPIAKGKYIAFLEADDYWIDPKKLQKQIDLLESNPNIAMCFTAAQHIYPQSKRKPRIKRYRPFDCLCSTKDVIIQGGRLLDMGSAVVKKSVFDELPEWYTHRLVWDVSVPLLSLLHGKILYLNEVTTVYRYNTPGSLTQNNVKNYENRRNNIKDSIRLTDGFNQATNFKYNKFVSKKINSLIIHVLLLMNPENFSEDEFSFYYSKIPLGKKIEVLFFKRLGSFRLWERYRQVLKLFSLSKYFSQSKLSKYFQNTDEIRDIGHSQK